MLIKPCQICEITNLDQKQKGALITKKKSKKIKDTFSITTSATTVLFGAVKQAGSVSRINILNHQLRQVNHH